MGTWFSLTQWPQDGQGSQNSQKQPDTEESKAEQSRYVKQIVKKGKFPLICGPANFTTENLEDLADEIHRRWCLDMVDSKRLVACNEKWQCRNDLSYYQIKIGRCITTAEFRLIQFHDKPYLEKRLKQIAGAMKSIDLNQHVESWLVKGKNDNVSSNQDECVIILDDDDFIVYISKAATTALKKANVNIDLYDRINFETKQIEMIPILDLNWPVEENCLLLDYQVC